MSAGPLVALLIFAGLAYVLAGGRVAVPGAEATSMDMRGIVWRIVNTHFPGRVDGQMVLAIGWIESGFNPTAVRYEARINDASVGVMQTLVATAQWLAADMGYTAYGVPDFEALLDAETSVYFGAAYLDYLANRNGLTRGGSEETIVRAYNGGPGGASSAATAPYWAKYQAAKPRFQV